MKFIQWLRRLFGVAEVEEEVIFPDAETLRKETLENTPFITDKQILKAIREAQKESRNWTNIWRFQISTEMAAKLKDKDIMVIRHTNIIGFQLRWDNN